MAIYIDASDNTQPKRIVRIREASGANLISEVQILEKLEKSDRWMETMTNKFDWVNTDAKWESFLEASENRAASKLPGISVEKQKQLIDDYRSTLRGINHQDTELTGNTLDPVSVSVNVTNQLDNKVYTADQDVFE